MNREIYLSNECISLAEYVNDADAPAVYACWQDEETASGYNYRITDTYEEFHNRQIRSRFLAVILRKTDREVIGLVSLSPENMPPDLAIMLFRPFRGQGYGTAAFALALQYCFDTFGLTEIYAGCYTHNVQSMKMLQKCGFIPHPEGDQEEAHYLDGSPVIQRDFVKYRE